MLFLDWLKQNFKYRTMRDLHLQAGAFFGVKPRAIKSWIELDRMPDTHNQEVIALKSNGQVCLNKWRTAYLAKQREVKA